jgi:hypothetical protein
VSDYNRYHDRLLASALGREEWQLAIALTRNLLGFGKRGDALGQRWLQEESRLRHRRSFERARRALVDKGLVRLTPGKPGRGSRDYYELVVDVPDAEKRAPTRA